MLRSKRTHGMQEHNCYDWCGWGLIPFGLSANFGWVHCSVIARFLWTTGPLDLHGKLLSMGFDSGSLHIYTSETGPLLSSYCYFCAESLSQKALNQIWLVALTQLLYRPSGALTKPGRNVKETDKTRKGDERGRKWAAWFDFQNSNTFCQKDPKPLRCCFRFSCVLRNSREGLRNSERRARSWNRRSSARGLVYAVSGGGVRLCGGGSAGQNFLYFLKVVQFFIAA